MTSQRRVRSSCDIIYKLLYATFLLTYYMVFRQYRVKAKERNKKREYKMSELFFSLDT